MSNPSSLIKFKTPYNYDTDISSFSSGLDCSNDPSKTQQHMAAECDINNLVKTFAKTGYIPGQDIPAMEFHVDEIYDYQSAMNQLLASQKAFGSLPSHIRDYFHNSPQHLLHFLSNPANEAEAIRLGLAKAKTNQAPANADREAGSFVGENPTGTGSQAEKA
ncbi:MAG: internal scaffolding protein [Microviridae sp.]|nr:MAG: internal scaffolding protein [Microviridae sp.]